MKKLLSHVPRLVREIQKNLVRSLGSRGQAAGRGRGEKSKEVFFKGKEFWSGLFLFLRELFHSPATMGAAVPSSKRLATKMAQQIPSNSEGYIIELGAGTGVVTAALLARGFAPEHIIVFERSESLAEHLIKRFPAVQIIHGDAQDLSLLLDPKVTNIAAIVSGLPLRAMPPAKVRAIGEQLEKVLTPQSRFIQFTYSWRKAYPHLSEKLTVEDSHYVWSNLPPARIDVFKRCG